MFCIDRRTFGALLCPNWGCRSPTCLGSSWWEAPNPNPPPCMLGTPHACLVLPHICLVLIIHAWYPYPHASSLSVRGSTSCLGVVPVSGSWCCQKSPTEGPGIYVLFFGGGFGGFFLMRLYRVQVPRVSDLCLVTVRSLFWFPHSLTRPSPISRFVRLFLSKINQCLSERRVSDQRQAHR